MNKIFWSANKIKVTIGFAIFILLFSIAIFNKKGILRVFDINKELDNIRSKIDFLKNENQALVESINSYRIEDFQIEKIAREDLGLAKENEVIIKIIAEEK